MTDAAAGETISLPADATVTLLHAFPGRGLGRPAQPRPRMWAAAVAGDVAALQARHGRPVRYNYVPEAWPLSTYQTVFARSPGSAEMPSAPARSRAAGHRLVAPGWPWPRHPALRGVVAGSHEAPRPEWFSVPPATATW